MQLEFLAPELLALIAVGVVAIIVLMALGLFVSAYLVGLERTSPLRSLAITIIGLILLALMIGATLGLTGPNPLPPEFLLSRPQLFIVYAVVWVVLIKLGFECSVLDAITVGAVSLILGIIAITLVLFMITILRGIFIPV